MDKCKKCGADLTADVGFCAQCGTKAGEEPEVKTVKSADEKPTASVDGLMKAVAGLTDAVKSSKASREEIERRLEEMAKGQAHLNRIGAFGTPDNHTEVKTPGKDTLTKAMSEEAKTYNVGGKVFAEDYVRELQEKADSIYITASVLKCHPTQLKSYSQFQSEIDEFKKAMYSTGSAVGDEWVPTGFSSELIKKVRLQGRVANLHRRITMPNNPYVFPLVGADPYMYLVGESTDATGTAPTESTPGTSNLTFTASKLGGRVFFSSELDEDSIVPIMPFIKDSLSTAISETLEYNLVNGDSTASPIDNTDQAGATIGAASALKAWDGYRKIAIGVGSMGIDANDLFATSGSTANGEFVLRNLRASMGKYGINTGELAWVTGAASYLKFLELPNVQTVDKYGPKAMVHTGEMGKYNGIPIIVTPGIREDLNASGLSGGATSVNTDTTIVLLNHRQFILADRRKYTVQSEKDIEQDRYKVVAHARHDFQSIRGTADKTVGYIYNL